MDETESCERINVRIDITNAMIEAGLDALAVEGEQILIGTRPEKAALLIAAIQAVLGTSTESQSNLTEVVDTV